MQRVRREYVVKVDEELQKIFGSVVGLMDKDPVPSANTGVLKLLRVKRKGDSYLYFVQFATSDARSEAAEDTRATHTEAAKIGEKDWVVTHPLRLSFTLNFSVFQSDVLQDLDEARKLARVAFDVEANQLVPQEQEHMVEETIDDPMPHVMEEIVEGAKHSAGAGA